MKILPSFWVTVFASATVVIVVVTLVYPIDQKNGRFSCEKGQSAGT